MQKFAALLLIIFFSIPLFSAESVDSRTERWNMRIDRMKNIRNEALSGRVNMALVDEITSGEIKSGGEFLSLLDRYKKEDGSLKSETKKYSLTDIEKKVKDLSLPAISLYYISDLHKTAGDAQIKEMTARQISDYASEKFGKRITISPEDKSRMAEQYILEKGITEFDSAVRITTSDLLSKTEYELSRSDYNSNESDICRIIQKHIEDSLPGRKFFDNTAFDEKYISHVPQWKIFSQQYSNTEERKRSVMNFVHAGGGRIKNTEQIYDIESAEKEIFDKAKEKISDMLQNTTPENGAMGNNPYYEIPDVKKLGAAIDEIDRYRKTLMQKINGSEDKDLVSRLKNNNNGIAGRGINRIDAQFKSEEARIERLKKIKGDIIIYNEELFKASRAHFYDVKKELYSYAALSAEFLEALYSSGKNDPQKYIDFHKYRSERYVYYMAFSEKLTADTVTLSLSGSENIRSFYKGTIPRVLAGSKNLLKPEPIPADIRETFRREHLKEYAEINAEFRTHGSLLINGMRKNYDQSMAGFSRAAAEKKESSAASESRIGQDETDRLFSFAKKCSEKVTAMNYTETALNMYKNEFTRISEELKKGNKAAGLSGKDSSSPFFISIPGFNPDEIEKETATRELLSKEGMDALSGSITLVQFYKRKGVPVRFSPSNDEINSMKQIFSRSPEVVVSSWKMNGKNFRQIDVNVAAELKKLINKNAWTGMIEHTRPEILKIDQSGINVSFSPPSGWKKIPDKADSNIKKIIFESPDMKGVIEVTSICEEENNLQQLAGLWPKKWGFSMTEKNWGKKDNREYIKSTAKNSYDGIMESYMVARKGHVIILTGKTTGDMYRQMNKTLADIFRDLEINESSI